MIDDLDTGDVFRACGECEVYLSQLTIAYISLLNNMNVGADSGTGTSANPR